MVTTSSYFLGKHVQQQATSTNDTHHRVKDVVFFLLPLLARSSCAHLSLISTQGVVRVYTSVQFGHSASWTIFIFGSGLADWITVSCDLVILHLYLCYVVAIRSPGHIFFVRCKGNNRFGCHVV